MQIKPKYYYKANLFWLPLYMTVLFSINFYLLEQLCLLAAPGRPTPGAEGRPSHGLRSQPRPPPQSLPTTQRGPCFLREWPNRGLVLKQVEGQYAWFPSGRGLC